MLWDKGSNPPTFAPNDVMTDYGWTNPETGEVHVFVSGEQATTNSLTELYANVSGNMDTTSQANIFYDYATGENILIRVVFKEAVFVTGSPYVTVDVNGTNRHASFSRYRAKNVLEFVYPFVGGDSATAGQLTIGTSITLNSGTIKYASGSSVGTSFTAPDTSYITVNDSSAPAVGTVTISSNDHSATAPITGDVVTITVPFTKEIVVTGAPQISITINGTAREAVFSGKSDASALFKYTIQSADAATSSQVTVGSSISLNGGTIKDVAGNTAVLSAYSAPSTTAWTVNAGPIVSGTPTITSNDGTPTHPVTGDIVTLSVTWDKPTVVVGNPEVTLAITASNKNLIYYAAGSTALVHQYKYTVVGGDSATATNVSVTSPIALNSGTIKDSAGNAATLSFTPPTMTTWAVN